jgi:hypothetical protein
MLEFGYWSLFGYCLPAAGRYLGAWLFISIIPASAYF